jgi:hypothetical protein
MIAAEICMSSLVYANNSDTRVRIWRNIDPMEKWCYDNLGPKAEFRDQVSDLFPWTNRTNGSDVWWYFAREESATMFRLKWL